MAKMLTRDLQKYICQGMAITFTYINKMFGCLGGKMGMLWQYHQSSHAHSLVRNSRAM
jgi:hypothetical protein